MPHKRPKTQAAAPSPAAQLNADPGPLVLTLAINRVTSKLSLSGNGKPDDEHDLALLAEALRIASANVHQQMIDAAEKRGAAKAAGKEQPPAP